MLAYIPYMDPMGMVMIPLHPQNFKVEHPRNWPFDAIGARCCQKLVKLVKWVKNSCSYSYFITINPKP